MMKRDAAYWGPRGRTKRERECSSPGRHEEGHLSCQRGGVTFPHANLARKRGKEKREWGNHREDYGVWGVRQWREMSTINEEGESFLNKERGVHLSEHIFLRGCKIGI